VITPLRNIILLASTMIGLAGCSSLLYVTDKDGNNQIYKMKIADVGTVSTSTERISHNAAYADSYPDLSPDTHKLTYSSARSGQNVIATRDLADTSGVTERVLQSSASSNLMRPRWSCQQDLIAYAERTPGSDDAKIKIIRADGSGSPIQVANPGTYAGHDWISDGNMIIYSAKTQNTPVPTYGLSLVKSDGSGMVIGPFTEGELPVTSHDGTLLAYVQRIPLLPGTAERIIVANSRSFATAHMFSLQASYGGNKIAAIGFTGDDSGLYIATDVASVSTTPTTKRHELFRTKLDGTGQTRLTDNTDYDSQPDGIPANSIALCRRCVQMLAEQETAATQSLTINGVQFTAATLPSGTPSSIAITDYCPRNDGKRELKVGWSESSSGSGQFATIKFPPNLYGDGLSSVEVNACHFSQLRLKGYDKNNNLLADVAHTAGQNILQTLSLSGGKISRIEIIGAEIGIRDICYRP
jgi:Tol biopolymer transport system component